MNTSSQSRTLEPGTTGWTVDDLADEAVMAEFDRQRLEIIEGMLIKMPPPYFVGQGPLNRLVRQIEEQYESAGVFYDSAPEISLRAGPEWVPVADYVVVAGMQLAALQQIGQDSEDWQAQIMSLPPTIVFESVSQGHERHDRVTKRRGYAAMGVPHYWILDGYAKRLECLRLEGDLYVDAAAGERDDVLRVDALVPLTIELGRVFRI